MSDAMKQFLVLQISFKGAYAVDEKGIFETLAKGVKVLDGYGEFPHSPPNNFSKFRNLLNFSSGKRDSQTYLQIISQAFSFEQFSRPPTARRNLKFDFRFVRRLKEISRRINPRSPPIFI